MSQVVIGVGQLGGGEAALALLHPHTHPLRHLGQHRHHGPPPLLHQCHKREQMILTGVSQILSSLN